MIVIADHLPADTDGDQPDLIIQLSDLSRGGAAPVHGDATPTIDLDVRAGLATVVVQARRAIWERI
jgi:hypothetical protein